MIIRAATEDDARQIADIWNPQIRDTAVTFTTALKTPAGLAQDIAARTAEGKAFLVAEKDGRILGFATYFQFRGGPGYARTMEHSVILSPDTWGQGIGRALMGALEQQARGANVHSLFAGVSSENPRAIAFHQKIGFTRVATLPEVGFKFGRWMDLVLLQKLLCQRPDNAEESR